MCSLFVGVSAAILGRRYVDYKAAVACLFVWRVYAFVYFVVAVYRPPFFPLPYLLFPFAADFSCTRRTIKNHGDKKSLKIMQLIKYQFKGH